MFNEGKFKTNIQNCSKLLRIVNLLKDQNDKNINILDFKQKYSREFIDNLYCDEYKKIYDIAMRNSDYDLLLIDESFFQFSYLKSKDRTVLKYSYYPNPYIFDTIEKFKKEMIKKINNDDNELTNLFEEKLEYELEELYEQYKIEAELKKEIIPFRYDYDDTSYSELVHPRSHLHIGLYNETRMPINYIMLPNLFVLYIIILLFPNNWRDAVVNKINLKDFLEIKNKSKECKESELLNEVEKKIIYIN